MTPVYTARIWSATETRLAPGLRFVYTAERLVAALALILLVPFTLLIAVTIILLSRRGPLISHQRVGWRGEPLPMLKFRTMWEERQPGSSLFGIEQVAGPVSDLKDSNDRRVNSGFAAFCRRYSLDELPQLYHVARGEMSLVGPRPITQQELEQHYADCADEVVSLRPGLTGLWQIMGRSGLSYAERRRLDLQLVRDVSPRLYFSVLVRTIPKVLAGRGAC